MNQNQKPILLVEDDIAIQENLRMYLELEGYQVHTASNGQEALAYLQAGNPVMLITLDLMMPVMNGYEFLKKIRDENSKIAKDVPILIVSAANDIEQIAKTYRIPFIEKPFSLQSLADKIMDCTR